MREAICRVLSAEGFLAGVEVGGEVPKKKLVARAALLARRASRSFGESNASAGRAFAATRAREFDAARAARDGRAGGDDAARRDDRSRGAAQKSRRRNSAAGFGRENGAMSRIGRLPVILEKGVKADVAGDMLKVEGPKGKLELRIPAGFTARDRAIRGSIVKRSGRHAARARVARPDAQARRQHGRGRGQGLHPGARD